MIVRRAGDSLHLITQPDHARLSGEVMQHTVALRAHPRRSSTLLAISEHDNGWLEPDSTPRVDRSTGSPFDFITAPIEVRQGVWARGIARLQHDPWAAALVAQHAATVYERYRGDSAWASFFSEMETARQTMLDASGGSLSDLLSDYRFVRLGDLISLTFCNNWGDVQQFDEWSIRLSGSQMVVSPDVFGGMTIPFAIDATEIPQRVFRTDADLRDALAAAPVITLRGAMVSRAV